MGAAGLVLLGAFLFLQRSVYSHWQLIINAEALRGYSDMALRLSKHCLYMNSQHSESFKAALWNVSDSPGEKLITVEMFFSRSPRYSLWMPLPGKYGVFLFVYIKKHVNKETVSTCSSLGVSTAVHKRELVCAEREKKKTSSKKLKIRQKKQRCRIQFTNRNVLGFF